MRNLISGSVKGAVQVMGLTNYARFGGLLVTPRTGNSPRTAIHYGSVWALDNDAFSGFDEERYTKALDAYAGVPMCLFAVAPDVVSDAHKTLCLLHEWRAVIVGRGYPVGFALQNGMEALEMPWGLIDAVFIGGDTSFKLGAYAAEIARQAKQRGLWVHMGRCGSGRRIRYAKSIGCDSFDSSGFARFMRDRVPGALPHQLVTQLRMEMDEC